MTLRLILLAAAVLGVFGAIWIFFVIPGERRDHQRRLDLVQRKLEKRQETIQDNIHTDNSDTTGNDR